MPNVFQQRMSRRRFLRLSAIAAVGALALPLMTGSSPQISKDRRVLPLSQEESMNQPILEFIRMATLAPNGHNTQPWIFSMQDTVIRMMADANRHLAEVDPNDREQWISLGCALENLVLSAAAAGFAGEVETFPPDEVPCLKVTLHPDQPTSLDLAKAIPLRQSTRSLYYGQPVPNADLDTLLQISQETSVSIHLYTAAGSMEPLIQAVMEGDRRQYQDKAFVSELIAWLRFNETEAQKTLDGLYTKCMGNPSVPRWIGKAFVSATTPDSMAKQDEKKMRSSSGLVLFTTGQDDRAAWVDAGRAFERFALTANTLGIKTSFMNQPIEVPEIRSQLCAALNLGTAYPQLLARFGYAPDMPRSYRRPVSEVLLK